MNLERMRYLHNFVLIYSQTVIILWMEIKAMSDNKPGSVGGFHRLQWFWLQHLLVLLAEFPPEMK